MQEISVALTADQVVALQSAVEAGEYATASEAVREALGDWQRRRGFQAGEVEQLRRLWAEGKASGEPVEVDFAEVRREAQRRLSLATSRNPHAG